ncbi:MAG: aldehyde ferredoxin oxidoreductase family protein [Dehalococcoidales bacterium]|nr:aldehyde ferredoxin oxidoreductase family protein [Dehalococcoidales bacterium]
MTGGYIGKTLFVDLSKGELKDEVLDEKINRDFIGGYGVGARILHDRQKAGVDPLGPENTLGFISGPLSGTPTPFGSRYGVVIGKSPLTGGWGDANSGGDFGPHLKFAGYDGIFITGASEKPVYLFINDGKAELKDASHLWGKDTSDTEDMLKAELGKEVRVASIGPAGEKLSLISGIMNNKWRAAARSGVGAVMGSKKLKAVAVLGTSAVPIADTEKLRTLRREFLAKMTGPIVDMFRKYGTAGMTAASAHSGDSPVKNWDGIGIRDYPNANLVSDDHVIDNLESGYGCYRCPLACGGHMKAGKGEYKYLDGTKKPEYETLCTFGAMCLNDNVDSIIMANDICNRYGLDTISAGCVIAFAIECYENGIITKEDTEGIELTWGNHKSIVAMTEKMAKREGLGDILADGVKVAAEKIGKGAEQYAIHIGGQELGMHDPKFRSPMRPDAPAAARYQMDATPGRHTQGFGPSGFQGHIINSAGLCMFAGIVGGEEYIKNIAEFMSAITGWDITEKEILKAAERIANMRHVMTLREGINPLELPVHPRIIGNPPQEEGPLAGVTADSDAQNYWNLGALDWDRVTTKPSKKKLLELGLDDIANELWPPPETDKPSGS